MKRRQFIALLSAAATTWPLHATSQSRSALIGFLSGGSPYEWAPFVAAFRQGLGELGYVEARNASIQFRWALGDREQTPILAQDLLSRGLDLIVSSGGIPSLRATLNASPTVPVVAMFGDDPFSNHLAAILESTARNATGVTLQAPDIEIRRLEVLQKIVPGISKVGIVLNAAMISAPGLKERFESAAQQLGLESIIGPASTEAEIDEAFASLSRSRVDGAVIASSAYYLDLRDRFAALATRYRIPVMYPARAYVESGGLVSYGVDRLEAYRQLGRYAGRVLHGELPADMPVLQPSKFELVINTRAATAIGLTVPQSLLTLRDAIIQ